MHGNGREFCQLYGEMGTVNDMLHVLVLLFANVDGCGDLIQFCLLHHNASMMQSSSRDP